MRINNLLRTILGVTWVNDSPLLHDSELYKQMRLMNFSSIYKLNLFKLLRQFLDGKFPEFWEMLLGNYVIPHTYNTRGVGFRHPNISCEIERRALSFQLIMMIEELPPGILEVNSKASINQMKKTLLALQ